MAETVLPGVCKSAGVVAFAVVDAFGKGGKGANPALPHPDAFARNESVLVSTCC